MSETDVKVRTVTKANEEAREFARVLSANPANNHVTLTTRVSDDGRFFQATFRVRSKKGGMTESHIDYPLK